MTNHEPEPPIVPTPNHLCPDRDWCLANGICYWNCHADPDADLYGETQSLPRSASDVDGVVDAPPRTDEALNQMGGQWGTFFHRRITPSWAVTIIIGWIAVLAVGTLAYSMRSRPLLPPVVGTPVCPFAGPCPSVLKGTLPWPQAPEDQQSVAHETKGDRDPVRVIPLYREPAAEPEPKPPIAPAAEPPKPAIAKEAPPPEPAAEPEPPVTRHWHEREWRQHLRPSRNDDHGLCARHGMHKVESKNGKSWHCK